MDPSLNPKPLRPKNSSSKLYFLFALLFAIIALGLYYKIMSPGKAEKPENSSYSKSQENKEIIRHIPKIIDSPITDKFNNPNEETRINIPPSKVISNSEYPGGQAAWVNYLIKNLRYPLLARDNGIQGSVVVEFTIDEAGNLNNIKAIAGPEELRNEAERVIYESGKWIPARQGGVPVKSYKKQPIKFSITE